MVPQVHLDKYLHQEEKEKKELSESERETKKKYLGFTKFRDQSTPPGSCARSGLIAHRGQISSLVNKKERARTKEQSVARAHIYILFFALGRLLTASRR